MYRCEARSVEGFVQQLACNLVNKGYWFYFMGRIPERKDPLAVDQKLIQRYGLDMDKFARARRKRKGMANVAYLRFGRVFVLIATVGEHIIHAEHPMKDIRRQPIHFHGYSIGCGKGSDGKHHASVKVEAGSFEELVAFFLSMAAHRTAEALAAELQSIRFVPYARIRRQLLKLLRLVNEKRKAAGFELVPPSALRLRRVPVKVFIETRATTLESALKEAA